MDETHHPLRIACKNCGSPVGFDTVRQTYRCVHCGELSGIQEVKDHIYQWRELEKSNNKERTKGQNLEENICPSCGAHFVFQKGEAQETCAFCESKLIRREFTEADQLPELIIPFFLTYEEARKRMLDWGHSHEKTPEGRSVVSSMNKFRGCYLPYQLVQGPVYGTVKRDGNRRTYRCAGYLEGTAVNTSGQVDNQVLNEMEPFDWSQARPFEYGYIAGQNVKLSDLSDQQIDKRIREEVTEDFRPEVEKVMETSGIKMKVETGSISVMSALLPVYFMQSGELTAVMNGQTGRIAVSKKRKKESNPWMMEPLLYTIGASLLTGAFYHFAWEPMLIICLVFACIFFSIFGDGRKSLIRVIRMHSETAKAKREDGELIIEEGKDILKNPYDNTPVFYEPNREGKSVPVKIRFYTLSRWISILRRVLTMVFLPAILAAFIRWVEMEPQEVFWDGYHFQYGAAWYVMAGAAALLYLTKGVRKDLYDHPILYEILPNGKKRLIGSRAERKIGLFSMFGVGQKTKNGKKVTLFSMIKEMGALGVFLFGAVLVIFLVSTFVILM